MMQGYQLPNSQNVLAQRAGMMAMQPRPQFGAPMQPMSGAMGFQMPQMQMQLPMQPPVQQAPNPMMSSPVNIARQRMMGMM